MINREFYFSKYFYGAILIGIFIFVNSQNAFALCAAPKDLNGVWHANDGGTYYVRQIGNEVWWLGMSGDSGKSWTNVYKGTRNGNQVTGRWADVPRGHISSSGSLNLNIRTSGGHVVDFTKGSFTGGFGGSHWTMKCDDVILNPVDD